MGIFTIRSEGISITTHPISDVIKMGLRNNRTLAPRQPRYVNFCINPVGIVVLDVNGCDTAFDDLRSAYPAWLLAVKK